MATNKVGMTESRDTSGSLAGVLIKMLAAGVAGSAVLLAVGKYLGEKIEDIEVENYLKLQEKRYLSVGLQG